MKKVRYSFFKQIKMIRYEIFICDNSKHYML